MTRALVLNASFEPLTAVSYRRAIILVLENKAELLEHDRQIQTTLGPMAVPTVIRLINYVSVKYRKGPRRPTLSGLIVRDGELCAYCQKHRATSIDHIIPRAQGGTHTWMNTCASCDKCNNKKANATPHQAGMKLSVTPREPSRDAWFMVTFTKRDPTWEPYLQPFEGKIFVDHKV